MPEQRAEQVRFEFSCCEHCGCKPDERVGHDDTCSKGCNDDELCAAGFCVGHTPTSGCNGPAGTAESEAS